MWFTRCGLLGGSGCGLPGGNGCGLLGGTSSGFMVDQVVQAMVNQVVLELVLSEVPPCMKVPCGMIDSGIPFYMSEAIVPAYQ